MGQIICAVVAETDVQAKRAIEKIKITYEELEPVILTIEVSRVPGLSCKAANQKSFVNFLMQDLFKALLLSRHWFTLEKSTFSGRYYLHELKLALVPRNMKKNRSFLLLHVQKSLEMVSFKLACGSECQGLGSLYLLVVALSCMVSIL